MAVPSGKTKTHIHCLRGLGLCVVRSANDTGSLTHVHSRYQCISRIRTKAPSMFRSTGNVWSAFFSSSRPKCKHATDPTFYRLYPRRTRRGLASTTRSCLPNIRSCCRVERSLPRPPSHAIMALPALGYERNEKGISRVVVVGFAVVSCPRQMTASSFLSFSDVLFYHIRQTRSQLVSGHILPGLLQPASSLDKARYVFSERPMLLRFPSGVEHR